MSKLTSPKEHRRSPSDDFDPTLSVCLPLSLLYPFPHQHTDLPTVTGPPAYAEDHWKKVRMGLSMYHVINRCVRCRLPNIDPDTAIKHDSEPDKTLRSFRCIDPGAPKSACLGMDMVAVEQQGMITVGDVVEVLETGEHRYIGQ
jgi:uncharacterized protein YcbX